LSPTLNTLAPENAAHGSEILLQAQGPASGAAFTTIAEIFEMQYDVDNKLEPVPILGTRRIAYRRGRFEVKGSVKAYWLNSVARSMMMGVGAPSSAGSLAQAYESQVPYIRYNMIVVNANWPGNVILNPLLQFINVTFEKDTIKWSADKITQEDITFFAEDVLGQ
jgi:hypothetical protein